MEKQSGTNDDQLSRFLPKPLRDTVESLIRDILISVKAPAGFFIFFEAFSLRARILSVNAGEDKPEKAKPLEDFLEPVIDRFCQHTEETTYYRLDNTRCLFDMVFEIAKKSGLTSPEIRGAAVHWLKKEALALGNTSFTKSGAQKIPIWDLGGEERPLLPFQDALDWAATFKRNLGKMKRQRHNVSSYEVIKPLNKGHAPTVLKIHMAPARQNLQKRDLLILLAEHIIALDKEAFNHPETLNDLKNPKLTYYFMPIRGIAQWRAAIVWLGIETEGSHSSLSRELAQQVSELSKSAAEELLTLSLINVFTHSVRNALVSTNLEGRRTELHDAFSILWWSKRIEVHKNGKPIKLLVRNAEDSSLVEIDPRLQATTSSQAAWEPISTTKYEGFFYYDKKQHPEFTSIKLLIDPVIDKIFRNDPDAAARIKRELPFQEVRFLCSHFQATEHKIGRWVDQVAESLAQIIKEQDLRRTAEEVKIVKIYEEIAHWLKGLVRLADLNDTQNAVRKVLKLQKKFPELKKINNALTLLTILDESLGLLRLIGILSREEYRKLEKWFSAESRSAWHQEEAFRFYKDALIHLARSVGSAQGKPLFEVTIRDKTGAEYNEFYNEDCSFDPSNLIFPPLDKSEDERSIFALIPAFVEPLINALEYSYPPDAPVKLVIEDHRKDEPAHILVSVGNRCPPDKITSDPDGVKITRQLMELTKMAEIKEGMYDYKDGRWWVSILLHPQKLDEMVEEDKRKMQGKRTAV